MIAGPRAAGAEGSGRSLVVSIVREAEVLRFRLSLGDRVVNHRFMRARPCGDGGATAVCQKNLTLKCCVSREITYNWRMKNRDHISSIIEIAESEGVFTTAQAARLDIPRDTLHDACVSGRLERIVHGAYRLMGSGSKETDELFALWKLTDPRHFTFERLAHWDGICVGGSSAAFLNGMGDFHLSPYRFYSRRRINSRNPSARFGVRDVERRDVSFGQGVPVTRPERTVFDLILDREDPSLIADALHDAANLSNEFDCIRLRELLVGKYGEAKGGPIFQSLLANSGILESEAY